VDVTYDVAMDETSSKTETVTAFIMHHHGNQSQLPFPGIWNVF